MDNIMTASAPALQDRALKVLGGGGLVAIPTETVYGLAADACNGEAVARIYEVKERPSFNPLIAHCSDRAMAEEYVIFDERARLLADNFWPGALTLVLPLKPDAQVSDLLLAGLKSLAVRVPQGISREIIASFGKPLAAPSANLSGRISPTSASHVARQLGEKVDLIVDAGPCEIGLESTIISLVEERPTLLRAGGIDHEFVEEVLGETLQLAESDAKIIAPGMMTSHYAPTGQVRLNAEQMNGEEAALNFGGSGLKANVTLNLSVSGDFKEAAANLFAHLNEFDRLNVKSIAVAPISEKGLGAAINDRLKRAAAPRP